MAIRLLNKKQIKETKVVAQKRIQKINDYEKKATTELNDFRASVEVQKKQIYQEFVTFCADTESRKNALKNEVATLEARKKVALESLEPREKEVVKKLQLAREVEQKNILKEKFLEEFVHKLCIKEQELVETHLKNEKTTKSIDERLKSLQESEQAHYKKLIAEESRLDKLRLSLEKREKDVKKRETDVIRRESRTILVEKEFQNRTSRHIKRMEDWKKQLDDRQSTLDRGFAELRNKQNN